MSLSEWIASKLATWLRRDRSCHICGETVPASGLNVDGYRACSEEHAADIRRERAW